MNIIEQATVYIKKLSQ